MPQKTWAEEQADLAKKQGRTLTPIGPNEVKVPGAKYPAIKQKAPMDALLDLITQMTPEAKTPDANAAFRAQKQAEWNAMLKKRDARLSQPQQSIMQQMFGVTAPEWLQGILDVLNAPSSPPDVGPKDTGKIGPSRVAMALKPRAVPSHKVGK